MKWDDIQMSCIEKCKIYLSWHVQRADAIVERKKSAKLQWWSDFPTRWIHRTWQPASEMKNNMTSEKASKKP
jgi:hypothetical protein